MPVLGSSAYNTASDVSSRMRAILNDAEIPAGDVLTDFLSNGVTPNPVTFQYLNLGYERVQKELASVGIELSLAEVWFIGLPIMPTIDPEARMIIDDTGCNIIYPSGIGNVLSNTPQLPTDLVLPLDLWERQTATANFTGRPMRQPNGGLASLSQGCYLIDWEWKTDGLRFRGATQSQDVKMEYRKRLPQLAAPTDPVPIRDVTNAAAYFSSAAFAAGRGGMIAPGFKVEAMEEITLYKQDSARRRQRKQVRRQPYSGRNGRQSPTL